MLDPQWIVFITAVSTGVITAVLPKMIEGLFKKRVTGSEVEAAQESIETMRWGKAQADITEYRQENKRLRRLLRIHGIDPNESGPLKEISEETEGDEINGQ